LRKNIIQIKPIVILIFITLFALIRCDVGEENPINKEPDNTDGITMATPNGGELKPAERGPNNIALGIPEIELSNYQLEITGMVDSSIALSWEEIQGLNSVYTDTMLMYCVEGWEVWGNWRGVLVKDLLHLAQVQFDAEYITFWCADGYSTSLSIPYLEKYNAMLAYEVNGAPLKRQYGYPIRLVAFGKFGYKWAKWVNRLDVTELSEMGYWEKLGYSNKADVPLDRRKFYEGEDAQPLIYFPKF
jgi:DMSO/TMAO reductase YedYZ molybdopterin-dependent catalytic subunit